MKSKKIHYFLFGLIALLAFGVRFYKLGSLPASLNWDEVSHGYNAYSLLKTGKDQWGVSWPIFNFRAYGDYPTTLNLYLTILPVKLLGLSSFAIRLPSALLGFLTVIVSYFLGKVIFKEKKYALLLMLLTSISPWLVLPSRAVFQSTIAQFFLVSGITLFLFSLKKKKPWLFFFSLLFWALSAYGYHNTRMIAPVFFLGAAFFYKKEIFSLGKKGKLLIIASLLVFSLLSVFQLTNLFSPESRARGKWVFLIDQGAINQINEQRRISQLSPFWTRLKHNKVTYFVPKATDNLLSYFNPRYLFFSGGDHYQFSVPDRGVLNIAGLLFFYLGLIFLLKGVFEKKKMFWFLALWGGIGLVPAIITKGGFQVIRAMSILPLPQILIILGLKETCDFLKTRSKARGRLVFSAFVILALASFFIW